MRLRFGWPIDDGGHAHVVVGSVGDALGDDAGGWCESAVAVRGEGRERVGNEEGVLDLLSPLSDLRFGYGGRGCEEGCGCGGLRGGGAMGEGEASDRDGEQEQREISPVSQEHSDGENLRRVAHCGT